MPGKLPDLPGTEDIDPMVMTTAELREAAEKLWSWLEMAQATRDLTSSDETAIDDVTAVFNEITRERRRRHAEEFPMRGS